MKRGSYILDAAGEAIPCEDLQTWGAWMQKGDRNLRLDVVGDRIVSTIFLGLDHSFGDGPPLLFETLVFGERGHTGAVLWQSRYPTRGMALAGHASALELARQPVIPGVGD